MASAKIIESKEQTVKEIVDKVNNSASVILFDLRGLTVSETTELRRKLRETGADYKIYKNTLSKRAMESLKYSLDEHLVGPTALAFGTDLIEPIKVISKFAKEHTKLEIKVGIVDGKITYIDELKQLATIPSKDGLLTMLASSLIGTVRNLSICLDLYSKEKE